MEELGLNFSSEELSKIQKTQKNFEKMQREFIQSIESQSLQRMKITSIQENAYCVCEWQDKTYYRAVILKVDYHNFNALVHYIGFRLALYFLILFILDYLYFSIKILEMMKT